MKVISGGQSGVDRAALDAAIAVGLEYGGSVPDGRMAEDGPIDMRYANLSEMTHGTYRDRTLKNVDDGDATLIFTCGKPKDGTAYTITCAKRMQKPFLVVDLADKEAESVMMKVGQWLGSIHPQVLNVAGPRESKSPGIYIQVLTILTSVFQEFVSIYSH